MVGGIEGVGDEEFVDIVGDVAGDVLRNKKQKKCRVRRVRMVLREAYSYDNFFFYSIK